MNIVLNILAAIVFITTVVRFCRTIKKAAQLSESTK